MISRVLGPKVDMENEEDGADSSNTLLQCTFSTGNSFLSCQHLRISHLLGRVLLLFGLVVVDEGSHAKYSLLTLLPPGKRPGGRGPPNPMRPAHVAQRAGTITALRSHQAAAASAHVVERR